MTNIQGISDMPCILLWVMVVPIITYSGTYYRCQN